MYIPLITPTIPPATPGAFKSTGYATVHAQSNVPHKLDYPQLDGRPIMDLDGVSFAVYYPSTVSPEKKPNSVPWCPRPVGAVVDGYRAYFDLPVGLGFLFFLMKGIAGRFRVPLSPNAPVAPVDAAMPKYPLLIFSHGLAGTRSTYTQYCQALASEGYVVLAVEHRDGSGPMYVVPDDDGNRVLYPYAQFKKLKWGEGVPVPDAMRLRGLQLDYRVREVYEVYEAFKGMVLGDRDVMVEGMSEEESKVFLSQLGESVDVENVNLGGHSMGGATTFRAIQTAPPDGYAPMPVKHAVALDPWLPPFEYADKRPTPAGPLPPTLAINSQEYTEWEPHFSQLVETTREMGGQLVTITGMTHESFSDEEVLAGIRLARAQRLLASCHGLTMALFTDTLDDCEFVKGLDVDDGKVAKTRRGKLTTKDGQVIVHLA